MELLMNYVETDILDSHKQATAFNLVKAIIGRKVDDEKVCTTQATTTYSIYRMIKKVANV
jgi:uncharacterized protein YktA (UPF0223 family)